MSKAQEDANIYRQAAELNREDSLISGSTLFFPDYGQLVAVGDLHGHRRNFERIVNFASLDCAPVRHVLLQEIIHEEPVGLHDLDMSHELLLDAAKWKIEYPDQVHFMQSNHELAQLTGQEISKCGRMVIQCYLQGIEKTYGDESGLVVEAMLDFIRSYALAAKTPNRIMLSHSLPSPGLMSLFDPTVIERIPTVADFSDGGSAYLLVWGRHQNNEQLDALATMFDVDIFICGHQPQEFGYDIVHGRQLILASDHNHGAFLTFDLKKSYDIDTLEKNVRPLASIA